MMSKYWWCRTCRKEIPAEEVCTYQAEFGGHVGCNGMAEIWDDDCKYHPKRIDELEAELAECKRGHRLFIANLKLVIERYEDFTGSEAGDGVRRD